jgi:hypothetical protein
MSAENDHPILSENIERLSLSPHLLETLLSKGFTNLNEVLSYKSYELLERGFNLHDLTDLVEFLGKHGLEDELED